MVVLGWAESGRGDRTEEMRTMAIATFLERFGWSKRGGPELTTSVSPSEGAQPHAVPCGSVLRHSNTAAKGAANAVEARGQELIEGTLQWAVQRALQWTRPACAPPRARVLPCPNGTCTTLQCNTMAVASREHSQSGSESSAFDKRAPCRQRASSPSPSSSSSVGTKARGPCIPPPPPTVSDAFAISPSLRGPPLSPFEMAIPTALAFQNIVCCTASSRGSTTHHRRPAGSTNRNTSPCIGCPSTLALLLAYMPVVEATLPSTVEHTRAA